MRRDWSRHADLTAALLLTVGIRGIVVARYYDLFTTKNYAQGFNVIADYYRAVIVTS